MSFLYPRRIKIRRPTSDRSLGATRYSALRRHDDAPCVAEDVPASIQLKKEAQRPEGQLPADTRRRTYWQIMIEPGALSADVSILLRDEIEDDLGVRYQVLGPYLTALGSYQLLAELLEV